MDYIDGVNESGFEPYFKSAFYLKEFYCGAPSIIWPLEIVSFFSLDLTS